MNDLTCPYCGHEQEADYYNSQTNELYEEECQNCGKIFGYEIEYDPLYYVRELPCKNGEPHKWNKKDFSYLNGKCKFLFTCEYCGEEEYE